MPSVHRLSFTADAASWAPADVPITRPATPAGLAFSNLGSLSTSVTMSWGAVATATKYRVYMDTGGANGGGTQVAEGAAANWTHNGMVYLDKYAYYVTALNAAGQESFKAGPIKAQGGRVESSIAAGTGYVSGSVVSANRWRQNQWGYGGSNVPYIGWYTTEAYRYAGFYEIPDWHLRNTIFASYPQLNGYQNSITCTAAGIFFARVNGVGNMNNSYSTQVSLANGLAYASTAEPGAQVNVYDFAIAGQASGSVGYPMPPNWFQAIYQNHASYNGLLFRPYKNSGARQEYMAISQSAAFDMTLSWPKIVTASEVRTAAW